VRALEGRLFVPPSTPAPPVGVDPPEPSIATAAPAATVARELPAALFAALFAGNFVDPRGVWGPAQRAALADALAPAIDAHRQLLRAGQPLALFRATPLVVRPIAISGEVPSSASAAATTTTTAPSAGTDSDTRGEADEETDAPASGAARFLGVVPLVRYDSLEAELQVSDLFVAPLAAAAAAPPSQPAPTASPAAPAVAGTTPPTPPISLPPASLLSPPTAPPSTPSTPPPPPARASLVPGCACDGLAAVVASPGAERVAEALLDALRVPARSAENCQTIIF